MRRIFETATIGSTLDMVQQDVYELADSMRASADGMPEQLNGAHADAADGLEMAYDFLTSCDVPPKLRDEEVTWMEWRGKLYRPQQRDNVVNFLRAYLARLQHCDDTKVLRDNLNAAVDWLDGVYFPGMSGRRRAA